jgi:hypothetical protein
MKFFNFLFKEHIIRLKALADNQKDSMPSAKIISNPYKPPQFNGQQQQMPIIWVIAAVAMAIFGLILGKFVL